MSDRDTDNVENNDDNMLAQMEKFTFTEPITTLILVESDEETNEATERNSENESNKSVESTSPNKPLDMPTLDDSYTIMPDKNKLNNIIQEIFDDIDKTRNSSAVKRKSSNKVTKTNKKATIYKPKTAINGLTNVNVSEQITHSNNNYVEPPKDTNTPEAIDNQTAQDFVNNLLRTLSENMMYILTAYHKYRNLIVSTNDNEMKKKLGNYFKETKFKIFNLSYSTVANVIIPQKQDRKFLNQFINDTSKMVESRSYKYTDKELFALLHELITWAQQKQIQLTKSNEMIHNMQTNYPTLTRQLCSNSEIVRTSLPVHNARESTRDTNNVFDVNLLPNNGSLYEPATKPNNIEATTNIQYSLPVTQLQQFANSFNPMSTQNVPSSILYAPMVKYLFENQTNVTPVPNYRPTNEYYQTNQPQTRNVMHNFAPLPIPAQYGNNLQEYPSRVPVPSNITARPNDNQFPVPNQTSNVYYSNCSLKRYERVIPQAVQTPNTELVSLEAHRSSISRDSGFISPANLNVSVEETNEDQCCQEYSTPLISHVTSLNSDVSYIRTGPCRVCCKNTRNMCLGCYECYYCSHECQVFDWKYHATHCKRKNTM